MSFWSKTTAAPSILTLFSSSAPRFIRNTPAHRPSSAYLGEPKRASIDDVSAITKFWLNNYGGSDWVLDAREAWVGMYIADPAVVTLVLISEGAIIATIVSTPAIAGKTYMSNGGIVGLRVIEGLCVRNDMRGKKVAGHMIAWIDYLTSNSIDGPVAHLWMRETSSPSTITTAIAQYTYAYIDCARATRKIKSTRMSWDDFITEHKVIADYKLRGLTEGDPCIVARDPYSRRGDLIAWRSDDHMVVITNTRRLTRTPSHVRPIWEVVWYSGDPKTTMHFLESVASYYTGMLFASSGKYQGGASAAWSTPWVFGRSGCHAWYIYNYIPPAFGSCDVWMIREEI